MITRKNHLFILSITGKTLFKEKREQVDIQQTYDGNVINRRKIYFNAMSNMVSSPYCNNASILQDFSFGQITIALMIA